jgi:GT2 family glycosyltransferase
VYPIDERPDVEIIVPTGGNPLLEQALESVLKSTYPNFRIMVVDNSKRDRVRGLVKKFESSSRHVELLDCRGLPFNFSRLCNRAAHTSKAPYLLFLNDDTTVITPGWIEAMLEHGLRLEVGAVGALLLFPDDRIQHAGVLMGVYELAGHSFRMLDSGQSHYFHLPEVVRNCAAVTGACMLVRSSTFWEVGGFEEQHLPTAFQDVDLCLKMHQKGYRIIYTPHAKLYHHESATKTNVAYHSEIVYMQDRWSNFIRDDPYYNPNLTRLGEGYTLPI